eukprot:119607-Chlamydomonas_euryale.AAC.2
MAHCMFCPAHAHSETAMQRSAFPAPPPRALCCLQHLDKPRLFVHLIQERSHLPPGRGAGGNRAEQSIAERQSRAEQSRAEQSRAEQSRAEQNCLVKKEAAGFGGRAGGKWDRACERERDPARARSRQIVERSAEGAYKSVLRGCASVAGRNICPARAHALIAVCRALCQTAVCNAAASSAGVRTAGRRGMNSRHPPLRHVCRAAACCAAVSSPSARCRAGDGDGHAGCSGWRGVAALACGPVPRCTVRYSRIPRRRRAVHSSGRESCATSLSPKCSAKPPRARQRPVPRSLAGAAAHLAARPHLSRARCRASRRPRPRLTPVARRAVRQQAPPDERAALAALAAAAAARRGQRAAVTRSARGPRRACANRRSGLCQRRGPRRAPSASPAAALRDV